MNQPTPPSPQRLPARERARLINERLKPLYPEFEGLNYANRFQLLIAVILSAQCTDARVNQVTPALFARFPTPADIATCDIHELERLIQSTGYYKTKAKNIRAACHEIVHRFGGEVPGTLEELVTLPGVGRKTANVVLGLGFDTPRITVDTHVGRLSRRLGLTRHRNPLKVEQALAAIIPQEEWLHFSNRLIMHGRKVCSARKPRCEQCPLADLCPKIGVTNTALPNRSGRPKSRHRRAQNGSESSERSKPAPPRPERQ